MSKTEMEAMDREIEQKVNGKKADYVQRIPTAPAVRSNVLQTIVAAVWVLICLAAAAALVLVMYVPEALPWVVNAGVMCFVVAAAIIADRSFRRVEQ